jgi:hypothetical protein
MPLPIFVRKWLSQPSRLALLFGLGALSAVGTDVNAAPIGADKQPVRVPQQSGKTFGELEVWSQDGRIFLSESGAAPQELALGNTAETRRLKALLEQSGASANSPQTLQHRIILVGGGGDGFHWAPPRPSDASDRAGAPTTVRPERMQPAERSKQARPVGTSVAAPRDSRLRE